MTDSVWEGANRAACGVLGIAGREISTCTGESRRLCSQKCERHDSLVNSISVLRCSTFKGSSCSLSFRNGAHAVTAGVLARGCSQTFFTGQSSVLISTPAGASLRLLLRVLRLSHNALYLLQ